MNASSIFIVSGPSGAGEDSVIDGLAKLTPIERIITTTTRQPRVGEKDGSPYYFLSQEAFEQGIARGEFIEYAKQYNGNLYGVTRKEFERVANSGKVGIWKIEYQGVMSVKKTFPEITSILITVPSLDILEQRIRRRDGAVSEAYIKERMDYTREWLKHSDIYDYSVINEEGHLDTAIENVRDIITRISGRQA